MTATNAPPTLADMAEACDDAASHARFGEEARRLLAAAAYLRECRPREPTQAMIMAAIDVDSAAGNYYSWVWRAMYDAYAPGAADGAGREGR